MKTEQEAWKALSDKSMMLREVHQAGYNVAAGHHDSQKAIINEQATEINRLRKAINVAIQFLDNMGVDKAKKVLEGTQEL